MSSGVHASPGCKLPNLYAVDEQAREDIPCGEEADRDFQDFISESLLGRSPLTPLSHPADGSMGNLLVPVSQAAYGCFPVPEKLAALQDFGLRSSPASTNKRKRRYSSTGDLMHMPSKISWDTDSSGDSETQRLQTERPRSPSGMPFKRTSSSSLACTLMPFSLVKAFPSQNSLSLSDVNRRIQSVAEGDSVTPFPSQSSVTSALPLNSLHSSRSPYRPQIRVVHNYSSSVPETSPLYSHSFASQCEFP